MRPPLYGREVPKDGPSRRRAASSIPQEVIDAEANPIDLGDRRDPRCLLAVGQQWHVRSAGVGCAGCELDAERGAERFRSPELIGRT
jgi:hypothetical protein